MAASILNEPAAKHQHFGPHANRLTRRSVAGTPVAIAGSAEETGDVTLETSDVGSSGSGSRRAASGGAMAGLLGEGEPPSLVVLSCEPSVKPVWWLSGGCEKYRGPPKTAVTVQHPTHTLAMYNSTHGLYQRSALVVLHTSVLLLYF